MFVIATSQIIDSDVPTGSSSHGQGQRAPQQSRAKVIQQPPKQRIPSGKRKRGDESEVGGQNDIGDNDNRSSVFDDADDDSLYAIREGRPDSRASSVISLRKRPIKAAVKADRESIARELATTSQRVPGSSFISRSQALVNAIIPPPSLPRSSMPPPSVLHAPASAQTPSKDQPKSAEGKKKEPLFLPGSQLSQVIHDSGWGMLEDMDAEEFEKMMEEGDELDESDTEEFAPNKTSDPTSSSKPKVQAEAYAGGGQEDVQMQEAQIPSSHDDEEIDQLADDDDPMIPAAQSQGLGRDRESSFDLYYDETETQFGPTQHPSQASSRAGSASVSKVRSCSGE